MVERNLFSVIKAPTLNTNDLQTSNFTPNFEPLYFKSIILHKHNEEVSSLKLLRDLYHSDIVSKYRSSGSCLMKSTNRYQCGNRQLGKANKLVCSIFSKASTVHRATGSWTADLFIRNLLCKANAKSQSDFENAVNFEDGEIERMKLFLRQMQNALPDTVSELKVEHISKKALVLIEYLEANFDADSKGLIFVEQRAVVAAVAALLSAHWGLKSKLSISTFFGSSSCKNDDGFLIKDFETKEPQQVLRDFKTGTTNLIVTTNVLEEGIDVASCQLVICFDPPRNLISFIQRRGRARQSDSKYIVLLPEGKQFSDTLREMETFEEKMRLACLSVDRPSGSRLSQVRTQKTHVINKTGYFILFSAPESIWFEAFHPLY